MPAASFATALGFLSDTREETKAVTGWSHSSPSFTLPASDDSPIIISA